MFLLAQPGLSDKPIMKNKALLKVGPDLFAFGWCEKRCVYTHTEENSVWVLDFELDLLSAIC